MYYRVNLSMLMCVLLHLLICTVIRAHIIVVEALYKINYYYHWWWAGRMGRRKMKAHDQTLITVSFFEPVKIITHNTQCSFTASAVSLLCLKIKTSNNFISDMNASLFSFSWFDYQHSCLWQATEDQCIYLYTHLCVRAGSMQLAILGIRNELFISHTHTYTNG